MGEILHINMAEERKEMIRSTGARLEALGPALVPANKVAEEQMVNPVATRHRHDPMDLVGLAREVQSADQFVQATTGAKLQVIVDHIRYLQEQAQRILQDAHRDAQLHHAACNFQKVPGTIYHLYERDNGVAYFSMLGPKEWGRSCPHTLLGSYRLENDRSWTPAEVVDEKSKDIDAIDCIIHSHSALGYIETRTGSDTKH